MVTVFAVSLALAGSSAQLVLRGTMPRGPCLRPMARRATRVTGFRPGTFNDQGLLVRQQPLLREINQRIREVRQGPDGLIYLLTDEGALLRIEPAWVVRDDAPSYGAEVDHGATR